jgi:uncharacterized protein
MNQDTVISQVERFVKQEMDNLCVAHDFQHIQRVVDNTRAIQAAEWWNIFIIHVGALLHESLDKKFLGSMSPVDKKREIQDFLYWLEISEKEVQDIMFIVENVGFGKSLERWEDFVWTLEFQIVEDADRLEAIWAIAIARCFSYGWKKKRPIYDPDIAPVIINDDLQYAQNTEKSTSFNHFYEKLLLLKGLMHTQTGKQLAKPRHEFMELYVETFLREWGWRD